MSIEHFYCCGCKAYHVGYCFPKFNGLQETGKYCYSCWLKNRNSLYDETVNYFLSETISDVIDGMINEGE